MIQFILLLVLLHLAWLCESIGCLICYAVVIFVVFKFEGWMQSG